MLIKNMVLFVIGLASGLAVSAGIFAFIIMIGIVPRLAGRTHTAFASEIYENAILIGGTAGNIISVYSLSLPLGNIGGILFGGFSGMFVGCLAMALAEILNVVPIFANRIQLKKGMVYVIQSIALGKAAGAFMQMCYPILFK